MKGCGADLGSGYGYVSHFLLKNTSGVENLHLYEIEKLALNISRINLEALHHPAELSFEWHDVTLGIKHSNMDWIVSNPPVHRGKRSAVSLGESFVKAAKQGLRPGGKFYMVANAQLPYPRFLQRNFRTSEVLAEVSGFRVYQAQK